MKTFVVAVAKQVYDWLNPSQDELQAELGAFNKLENLSKYDKPSKYETLIGSIKKRILRNDCTIDRDELLEFGIIEFAPWSSRTRGGEHVGNCPQCLCVVELGLNCSKCENDKGDLCNGMSLCFPITHENKAFKNAYWNPYFISMLLSFNEELELDGLFPDRVEECPKMIGTLACHCSFGEKITQFKKEGVYPVLQEFDDAIVHTLKKWEDDTKISGKVARALKKIIHDPQMKKAIDNGYCVLDDDPEDEPVVPEGHDGGQQEKKRKTN